VVIGVVTPTSTANNIKGKNPERIIALGDYSYQPTATCWLTAINTIERNEN
jgi:hypothetical protein